MEPLDCVPWTPNSAASPLTAGQILREPLIIHGLDNRDQRIVVDARTMWQQGFDSYGRGHFGHGVGSSIWSEEWPFISSRSDAVLEPGMVLAFETPWYIDGLGGFIIEDQLLITETGHEVMAPPPRDLRRG